MKRTCVVSTSFFYFFFAAGTSGYHGYVASAIRVNKTDFRSFNVGKSVESDYVIMENEIRKNCNDFFTCVQLDMILDVSGMLKKDIYNLTENLVLERIAGDDARGGISKGEMEKLKEPDKGGFGYVTALLVDKTLDLFKSHSLKWNLIPGMDIRIFRNLELGGRMDVALEETNREPRTFIGPRKRLIMLLLPLMYKMGVMTTMLGGLVILTLKGLTISVILLILAVGKLFGKHKHQHGGWHHGPTDIHVHVHTDPHAQAYSGWQQEHHADHSAHQLDYTAHHADHSAHHLDYTAHHAEYPPHPVDYPHYRRRWTPPPQQPVPASSYSDLL